MINRYKHIHSYQILEKALILIFYISIFLLPTNLFLVWRIPESYIQGHFIDYLAPKLYVQQLSIGVLFLVWGLKHWVTTRDNAFQWRSLVRFSWKEHIGLLFLLATALIIGVRAVLNADWGLASLSINFLTGPMFLAFFLWKEKRLREQHLFPALLGSISFQSFIGLWQWLNQESLFGYWFFGEPNIRLPEVASSSLPGAVRKLPYGTTPHPNILAGWLIIGLATWIFEKKKGIFSVVFLLPTLLLLLITESWTAWGSLLFILFLAVAGRIAKRTKLFSSLSWAGKRSLLIGMFCVVQCLWLFLPQYLERNGWMSFVVAESSLTRRSHLQTNAFEQIAHRPLGSGFTLMFQSIFESEQSYIGQRFLQPAHNAGLFLITLSGIWVIIVLLLFSCLEHKYYSFFSLLVLSCIPIFTLDHFILSTITGQFLGILLFVFIKDIICRKRLR